jgi:hypothetical protein
LGERDFKGVQKISYLIFKKPLRLENAILAQLDLAFLVYFSWQHLLEPLQQDNPKALDSKNFMDKVRFHTMVQFNKLVKIKKTVKGKSLESYLM